jgi:hypothetical protein
MKLNRLLLLTALSLLAAGLSRADLVDVVVDLNDNPPTDGGSWGSGQQFNVTTNPDSTTDGYYQNGICTSQDGYDVSISGYDSEYDGDCGLSDASIRVNTGTDAPGFPTMFSSDGNGGGVFGPYDADGVNSILFTTTYSKSDPIFDGGDFQCSSNYYSFCGFEISDPPAGETISVLFAEPIPTAVPEPTYSAVFLTASGLLIWVRKARRSKRV